MVLFFLHEIKDQSVTVCCGDRRGERKSYSQRKRGWEKKMLENPFLSKNIMFWGWGLEIEEVTQAAVEALAHEIFICS